MTITRRTQPDGRTSWVVKLRLWGGLTLAVAKGCGLSAKRRGSGHTDAQRRKRNHYANCHERKPSLYHEQQGCCALCGKPMLQRSLQIHHVLPIERSPELGSVRKNLLLVCPDCHRELHQNPVLAQRTMQQAADTLGIDWRARYEEKVKSEVIA